MNDFVRKCPVLRLLNMQHYSLLLFSKFVLYVTCMLVLMILTNANVQEASFLMGVCPLELCFIRDGHGIPRYIAV